MNQRQLASLALFKTMYNKGDDIYQIISYFIKDCLHRNKSELTISDLQVELKDLFGVDIPFAVLKTTLNKRKDGILKKSGVYSLDHKNSYRDPLIIDRCKQEKFIYEKILRDLVDFIAKIENIERNEEMEELVLRNLCSYLLKKDDNDIVYYEHIASFIYKNDNEEVKDFLQNTFDSSIILAGLEYQNDTNEIYNLKKDLTLYLDMEWLFSAYGYNSEIYQKIFIADFLPLVKELNKKSKARIKLRILPKTKDDIEKFFSAAEYVLESGGFRENSAMRKILADCSDRSDVVANMHNFMNFLRGHDIVVDENAVSPNLNNIDEHKYNLDNTISRNKFCLINEIELDEHFQILNTINKLRSINSIPRNASFEDSSFIFITATKDLINISKDDEVKNGSIVPLCLDIGFVINRLWFKLQKSFKNDDRLLSLDILVNARIALDSVVNHKLNNIYLELMDKYNRNEISKELVTQLISSFRDKAKSKFNDRYNEISLIFEDDIEKEMEEISTKNHKLKSFEEDNNKKTIKIASLEEEKLKLESENDSLCSLLEKYKAKETKKRKICGAIKKLLITGAVMLGIYLGLRYVFPKYERELGILSILITVFSPFKDYLTRDHFKK